MKQPVVKQQQLVNKTTGNVNKRLVNKTGAKSRCVEQRGAKKTTSECQTKQLHYALN